MCISDDRPARPVADGTAQPGSPADRHSRTGRQVQRQPADERQVHPRQHRRRQGLLRRHEDQTHATERRLRLGVVLQRPGRQSGSTAGWQCA